MFEYYNSLDNEHTLRKLYVVGLNAILDECILFLAYDEVASEEVAHQTDIICENTPYMYVFTYQSELFKLAEKIKPNIAAVGAEIEEITLKELQNLLAKEQMLYKPDQGYEGVYITENKNIIYYTCNNDLNLMKLKIKTSEFQLGAFPANEGLNVGITKIKLKNGETIKGNEKCWKFMQDKGLEFKDLRCERKRKLNKFYTTTLVKDLYSVLQFRQQGKNITYENADTVIEYADNLKQTKEQLKDEIKRLIEIEKNKKGGTQ